MIRLEQAFGWPPGTAARLTAEQLSEYFRHHMPVEMMSAFGIGQSSGIGRLAALPRSTDDTAAFEKALDRHKTLDAALKELALGNQ